MRRDLEVLISSIPGCTVQSLHDAIKRCLEKYREEAGFSDFAEYWSCLAVREELEASDPPLGWGDTYTWPLFWEGRRYPDDYDAWWNRSEHHPGRLLALQDLLQELQEAGAVYAEEA